MTDLTSVEFGYYFAHHAFLVTPENIEELTKRVDGEYYPDSDENKARWDIDEPFSLITVGDVRACFLRPGDYLMYREDGTYYIADANYINWLNGGPAEGYRPKSN